MPRRARRRLVFAPTAEEMYPARRDGLHRRAAGGTDRCAARSRPGHFDGVATVVTKLLDIVQPDVAVFGEKDYSSSP